LCNTLGGVFHTHLFLDMFSGYVCFVVCIFCIGCLTAVIGDVASHFGCTVGVKDAVTAITFVALGTSVPGK
jgi:solute carrier family 8 (sodium/calcium exchanger)